ncbi:hypothetical protein Hypma_004107 [Hypsizygus marmoreus]|uniref:F-box domain-containing protein n=1 Tax=Hypsizygus marmoreus TaxID=39966 RepID=A0A369K967_HYPMA|nr:hypothetical protein Hypma_004107 [Hypsizygus marmoreus]
MPTTVDKSDESKYHHLLSTNDQASDEEAIQLQNVIANRELALAQLKAEIADLCDLLESENKHRKQEKIIISRFHTIFAPVRRLIRETLIRIFLFSREWENESRWAEGYLKPIPVGPPLGPSPLLITHVCSHWRKVALGEPTLWATIMSTRIPYNPSLRYTNPSRDFRLLTWLARSGPTMPLDITIEVWPYIGAGPTPLAWLKPYMHRIRTLSLLGEFNRLPIGSFESLEMLRMGSARGYDPASAISAPSLRRVCFSGEMFQPPTIIPWHQLTHLFIRVSNIGERRLYEVLSKCMSLVYLDVSALHFGIISDPDNDTVKMECIVLAHVQTLVTRDHTSSIWLFHHLSAPSLTTLRAAYFAFPFVDYFDFQHRSSFSLKSLSLSGKMYLFQTPDTTNYEILSLILRITPSLEEVILHNAFSITPALISVLTSDSTDGVLDFGPNLEYFAVSFSSAREALESYEWAVDDKVVLDMIESRDPSGKPGALEPNSPPLTRIFRSHKPKRSCIGKLTDFRLDETRAMLIIKRTTSMEALHIYF